MSLTRRGVHSSMGAWLVSVVALPACSASVLGVEAIDEGYEVSWALAHQTTSVCVARPGQAPVCAGTIWAASPHEIAGAELAWPDVGEPIELPAYVAESLGTMKSLVYAVSIQPGTSVLLTQAGEVRVHLTARSRLPAGITDPALRGLLPPVPLPLDDCQAWVDILGGVERLWLADGLVVSQTSTGAQYVLEPQPRAPLPTGCGEPLARAALRRTPERDGTDYIHHNGGYARREADGQFTVWVGPELDARVAADPPGRSLMTATLYVTVDGHVAGTPTPTRERRVSQHRRGRCALDDQGRGFGVDPDEDIPVLDGALWVDRCCGFFADGVARCPVTYPGTAPSVIELPLDL